jgi:ApaG protein
MNKPTLLNAKNIAVSTSTTYLASQSIPQEQRYVFSYTITITNNSNEAVQLLTRHWSITDANGDNSIVEGDGVIGQTPTISPQKSFTYTSGSMFKTPVGTMQGHYQMLSQKGQHLHVEIPVFRLAIPNILH